MGKWVVTVAGIAILSVLCDVILPEGQTRKYVKTVFGVVVSLVIVQPIIGFFTKGISSDVATSGSLETQQQYIESVVSRQEQYSLKTVRQLLESKGIAVKSIELDENGNRLVLELNTKYSTEFNTIVSQVAGAYFPKAELICIWSNN